MKSLAIFLFLILLFNCSSTKIINSRPESNYGFSIIQGSTTENSTIIRVIYPKKLKVTYQVNDSSGNVKQVKKIKTFSRKNTGFKVDHIKIEKLDIKETYSLKINSDKRKFGSLDQRDQKRYLAYKQMSNRCS